MKKLSFPLIFALVSFIIACSTTPTNLPEPVHHVETVVTTTFSPASNRKDVNSDQAESEKSDISQEYIELLAILTMAEAEGESEYGQRLVIDTVLNRVDNPNFPDNIYDVIWQKNQYSPMWGNRIKVCYVKEELVQLVREELEDRTNYDVIFFRTGHYHSFGTPLFKVGAHYFSSYD